MLKLDRALHPNGEAITDAEVSALIREAARVRLSAIDQVMSAGFGHLGSSMSCAEIIAGAFHVFDLSVGVHWGTDRFVLSKGHAVPMLYAAMTRSESIPYAIAGSRFPGHPNANLTPEVLVSSGSVGMGLAIGMGIAVGRALRAESGRVVVLMGDGELQAGMVWEAFINIARRPSLPILMIVDANGYQGGMAVPTNYEVRRMFEASAPEFRKIDGNDPRSVLTAMKGFAESPRATLLWAETRRGAGIPILERNPMPMTWRPSTVEADEIRCQLRNLL